MGALERQVAAASETQELVGLQAAVERQEMGEALGKVAAGAVAAMRD